MAKAKSARPSWRARVSRIRQRVRTSSGAGRRRVDGGVGEPAVAAEQRRRARGRRRRCRRGRRGRGCAAAQASRSSASALWRGSKKGQSRKLRSAISCPRTPASPWRRRRRRRGGSRAVCMQIAWACASASIACSRPIDHSWLSWVLVIMWAKVGPAAMRRASAERLVVERRGRDEAVEEAPGGALVGGHRAAGVEELGGAALADDARQHGAGAHVAAGEADAGEEEGGLRLGRAEAEVGGHGDDGAGADADAVDGGDDRLAAGEHRLDEVAGHPGEGEQALHVAADQRADDVVHVAAGAEVAAVRAEDDDVDVVGVGRARGTSRGARHSCRRSAGSCAPGGRARRARRGPRSARRKCVRRGHALGPSLGEAVADRLQLLDQLRRPRRR